MLVIYTLCLGYLKPKITSKATLAIYFSLDAVLRIYAKMQI